VILDFKILQKSGLSIEKKEIGENAFLIVKS